jgi:hypothetical protein
VSATTSTSCSPSTVRRALSTAAASAARQYDVTYLWVLRALDRFAPPTRRQAHTDDVAEVLAEFAAAHETVLGNLTSLRPLDNLVDDGMLHRLENASRAGRLARYRNRQSVYQLSELGHRARTGIITAGCRDAGVHPVRLWRRAAAGGHPR